MGGPSYSAHLPEVSISTELDYRECRYRYFSWSYRIGHHRYEALAIGLAVGMFQAATQINEMTLSFIPKLLVLVIVLMITGPWLLTTIVDYSKNLITQVIPLVIDG